MTQPASVGTLSQCSINGTILEYKGAFGLVRHQAILSSDGIRGTHNHPSERTRLGPETSSGPVVFNPGPTDMDVLLPLITGGAKNGSNVFPLAETLISFTSIVDRIAKVMTYNTGYVDQGIFRAAQGELLEVTLQIEALSESVGAAGSFPGGTQPIDAPYVMMDGVLTIAGQTYQFKEFMLTVNNNLKKDRFMNSTVRTDLPFLDRLITCDLRLPYTSDQIGLYNTGITAESLSITFTNGVNNLTIATSAFQIEPVSPDTPGREEMLLPLRGQFRSLAGGAPITFTNVG
jgi:hypothetical protein